MTFDELLNEFALALGLKDPLADGKTVARVIAFDGNWVTFSEDAAAKTVVMTAQIGALPGGDVGSMFVRALLSANFLRQGTSGRAVLGIDVEKGMCCLRRRDSLAMLDGKSYAAVVEGFLDILELWQRRLDDLTSLAGSVADFQADRAEEARSCLLGDGLVRV